MSEHDRSRNELSDLVNTSDRRSNWLLGLQRYLDPTFLYVSAATIIDSVMQDFTGLDLPERAIIPAAGVVAGKTLEVLDEKVLRPHFAGDSRAILATGTALVENAVLTGYLHGTETTLQDFGEVGFLQLLAYGGLKTAHWGAKKIRNSLESRGPYKPSRRRRAGSLATVGTLGLLAFVTATDRLNLGEYDIFTKFKKEGIVRVDEEKLGLEIRKDKEGKYAVAHLPEGGTVYSDIVLKYTDFLTDEDVMSAAEEIRQRNSLPEFNKIRSDHEIQIPVDMLATRYLSGYVEPARFKPKRDTRAEKSLTRDSLLVGKHMILDAGHGGRDPGSRVGGVGLEDEVSYDTMLRAKRALEARGATTYPIVRDNETGFTPQSRLTQNRDESVLVTPPYTPGSSTMAANLRAYEITDIYKDLVAQGVDPENIIFASFHSDALHPSKEGIMVYAPGANRRKSINKSEGKGSGNYKKFEEVREHRRVIFDGGTAEKQRSEGLSLSLADLIIAESRDDGIKVHKEQPVRTEIRRGRRVYIPAVMQGPVPTQVLVEVGNGANKRDSERLLDGDYREKVARAFTDAVAGFYANGNGGNGNVTAP